MKKYPYAENPFRLKKRYFVLTKEMREPKKYEYYLSGAIPEVYQALNDLSTKFHIVKEVNT